MLSNLLFGCFPLPPVHFDEMLRCFCFYTYIWAEFLNVLLEYKNSLFSIDGLDKAFNIECNAVAAEPTE